MASWILKYPKSSDDTFSHLKIFVFFKTVFSSPKRSNDIAVVGGTMGVIIAVLLILVGILLFLLQKKSNDASASM